MIGKVGGKKEQRGEGGRREWQGSRRREGGRGREGKRGEMEAEAEGRQMQLLPQNLHQSQFC